jgi:hypothetical protein
VPAGWIGHQNHVAAKLTVLAGASQPSAVLVGSNIRSSFAYWCTFTIGDEVSEW